MRLVFLQAWRRLWPAFVWVLITVGVIAASQNAKRVTVYAIDACPDSCSTNDYGIKRLGPRTFRVTLNREGEK